MPFDALPIDDTVMLNLMRGREAIERGWCKRAFRRRGRVCVLGALGMRGGVYFLKDTTPEVIRLWQALPQRHNSPFYAAAELMRYNDHFATKRSVLALYDRAIALEKAGGGL